ncbi:hypothetical protein CI109_102678 [Kwoniella shandongensis]|uniref:Methyltransferase domain-containing protein n=1 Tax=Kwoniella shandongensis TaxID=1734106 RepID=A0A5M6BUF1_9TREE|nr:uncharacterized protein CI109_005258 [Kwoniella shandongensis]KAA5526488.1 hypothetical protein CI109_005258 [Kwoniella shandongensis]
MSHQSSLTNHNPTFYQTNASFVYSPAYSGPVLSLLEPKLGEKIIDLGCGTGELTRTILEAVGEKGEVVGVDSNQSMLNKATSSSPSAITYLQADIQSLSQFAASHPQYEGYFDAVFTSATLHWCKSSPGGVVELVKWLLKPGGRMAFEFGGFGNCVGIRGALHQVVRAKGVDPIPLDPWYFPTVAQYEKLLKSYALTPQNVQLVPRPTPLPGTLSAWLLTFARNSFLSSFSDDEANKLISQVEELCRIDNYWSEENPGAGIAPSETPKKGEEGWEVMYVRLRGVAFKSKDE